MDDSSWHLIAQACGYGWLRLARIYLSYLRGKRYETEKKLIGDHHGNQYTPKMEGGEILPLPNQPRDETPLKSTAAKIAKSTGVSDFTPPRKTSS